jgi:hypothetical protein
MLTTAADLNATSAPLQHHLGLLCEELGNDEQALECYERAISYDILHIDWYAHD